MSNWINIFNNGLKNCINRSIFFALYNAKELINFGGKIFIFSSVEGHGLVTISMISLVIAVYKHDMML